MRSTDAAARAAEFVTQMRRATALGATLDPDELADPALADFVVAAIRAHGQLDGVIARGAHAANRRGVGAHDGATSTAAWLRWRTGMREGEARAAIEAGEVTELLPATGEAWRTGEISSGAAKAIVGARVEGHDEKLQAVEAELLDLAKRDLRTLRRAAQHFRKCALAEGTEPGARNGLYVSKTFEGTTVVNGQFEDLAGETVLTALHAYTDPPSDTDTRSTARRRADAFVRICEVALAQTGDMERDRAQVSIVIDWATLVANAPGRLDGLFTGPIHERDIERLLCDCEVSRVVTGPDGLPLDVGRIRRTPTPAIRRAVIARDGGCRYPGCDRPAGFCEVHHVVHWINGGRTAVHNLVLLCDRHHHVIHLTGWIVKFDGHELRVIRPDGTEVEHGRDLSRAPP
jgi:hypothetical protein